MFYNHDNFRNNKTHQNILTFTHILKRKENDPNNRNGQTRSKCDQRMRRLNDHVSGNLTIKRLGY